jgi:hypothetical protein
MSSKDDSGKKPAMDNFFSELLPPEALRRNGSATSVEDDAVLALVPSSACSDPGTEHPFSAPNPSGQPRGTPMVNKRYF